MKKVLVIGASGSLGKGVIQEIKSEYDITGTYTSRSFEIEGIKTQKLDIVDPLQFDNLEKNFDTVFLVAGAMPAMMEGYQPQHYIDVNVSGVLNVLEYCRKNNIKKLIYIMTFSDSSGSFYNGNPILDEGPRTLTLTGDHAVYAITKVAACDLIEHYHQEYGLQTIIFRIPTVYCCDNNINYYVDGKLKTKSYIKMIRSVIHDKKLELWGNINNAKDMPYIKDFAMLISKAIKHPTAQGVFNAGTGTPISLKDFSSALIEVFSGKGDQVAIEEKPNMPSQPNFTFNMDKTKRTFDYSLDYDVRCMLIDIRDNSPSCVFEKE